MIWVWCLKPFIMAAQWIVNLLPKVDYSGIAEHVGPVSRLLASAAQLNEAFPVTEGLIGLGLLLVVVVALYSVMLIRRIFSLLWPGAGS